MNLADYTTPADVRAVLGVSVDEIEDVTILSPIYATRLSEQLYDFSATMQEDYAVIQALPNPSTVQTRFLELMQTYCAYHVARQLLGSVKMFAPKTFKDSKSEVTRVDDPYAKLAEDIASTLSYLVNRMLSAYASVTTGYTAPSRAQRTSVRASAVGTNPVTG